MKTIVLWCCLSLVSICNFNAQSFETDKKAQKDLLKLNFIIGEWEGSGWRMSPEGVKHTFEQTERVQYKLDSTAILIEGKGTANGQVIHNAMAVITSNDTPGEYEFQSFLQNGMKGNFKAEIRDNVFYWYPNENVRYIIKINEQGEWFETGEYQRQGEWMQFFEMTLFRK